jgi:Ca-activated chloride channel homolog
MSYRFPALLWMLAAVPLALLFLVVRERSRSGIARRFTSERLRGGASPLRSLRPWILSAGLAAAVVALAGPYAGYELVPITGTEVNRILVVDVSNSMAAEDVGTSRLAAAKALAARLAAAQEGRIGLIVFEAAAEVAAPLTTDSEAVVSLIETLMPGELGQPGSDLGGAVIAALRLLESDPTQKADVVLISDGEEQGGRIGEAVRRAKMQGIAVSTVVVGSAAGSTIPTPRGPLRDQSGDVVTTYARSASMREIASGTGGMFLENPFAARALDPLLRRDGEVTRTATHARVPVDRYQWPLGLAFVAFLAASLIHRGAE